MAALQLTTRRIIFAGGLALGLAVAPAVAVFSYPIAQPAPRILADPAQCTGGESMDAYALSCVPDIVPNTIGGAPSEMQLTDENPGFASPSHR